LDKLEKDYAILHKPTGEIVGEFCKGDTFKITSEKQKESFKDQIEKEKKIYENYGKFTFYKQQGVKDFIEKHDINLSDLNYLGAILILSSYMDIDDGNKLPFRTIKELSEVLNINERQCKTIVSKAKDKGLLFKNQRYYVLSNDILICGSAKDEKNIIKSFHSSIKQLLENEIKLQDLGLLFLIFPYISYIGNYIAKNPNSKNIDNIHVMNIKELSEEIGIDYLTLRRKMGRMSIIFNGYEKYGELGVFGYYKSVHTRKIALKINPLVLCRDFSKAMKNGLGDFIVTR